MRSEASLRHTLVGCATARLAPALKVNSAAREREMYGAPRTVTTEPDAATTALRVIWAMRASSVICRPDSVARGGAGHIVTARPFALTDWARRADDEPCPRPGSRS